MEEVKAEGATKAPSRPVKDKMIRTSKRKGVKHDSNKP